MPPTEEREARSTAGTAFGQANGPVFMGFMGALLNRDGCARCWRGSGGTGLGGTLMRHLRAPFQVALLASGVVLAAALGSLVDRASAPQALAAGLVGAAFEAVDVAAITLTTESYLTRASGTRVHAERVDGSGRPPLDG